MNEKKKKIRDWDARLKIAVGLAQGLEYLHHDCVLRCFTGMSSQTTCCWMPTWMPIWEILGWLNHHGQSLSTGEIIYLGVCVFNEGNKEERRLQNGDCANGVGD